MKKIIVIAALFSAALVRAQEPITVIPQPVKLERQEGYFSLSRNMKIIAQDKLFSAEAKYLAEAIPAQFGLGTQILKTNTLNERCIYLKKDAALTTPESYRLEVNRNAVTISAATAAGIFRGIQTFLQLVPNIKTSMYSVPCVLVEDAPRFAYRGMHLDVGRHFFPVSFIKTYIDYLVRYKYNTFHWHLTEDQGWRIEIKKYPKLTSVGGCRNGTIIGRYPGTGNDNLKYCGWYTQEQIKEIVQYATARHIAVIPEIELPGHSSAALTAYPELGCTGGPYKVQETWGVFEEVFCAGSDKTFAFLQDVLDEVMQLFPSKYIHIGGDECPKESWKKCARCQGRKKEKGLKDEHELQSYFIQRIEKYLNGKGRNIIGWDEILEGGLAPNATVMSWRGEEGGIAAARQQHNVIMTPGSHCYFDHSQSRNEDSVTIGGFTTLDKVYSYEPVPAVLNAGEAKYILGAQANVWTEYMKNTAKVEYMIFPRMLAMAEVLWSPKEARNWNGFEPRLLEQLGWLKRKGVNFSTAYFDLGVEVKRAALPGSVKVTLKPRKKTGLIQNVIYKPEEDLTYVPGVELLTLNQDGEAHVTIDKSSRHAFRWVTGNDSSRAVMMRFYWNKATGRDIKLTAAPAKRYPGEDGANGLVNGLRSAKGIASPEWLGWEGGDLEAVIDLGSEQAVSKLTVHTLDQTGSWIYLPKNAEVSVSADGQTFTPTGGDGQFTDDKAGMKWMTVNFSVMAFKPRYIKLLVKNYGVIPAGQPGAGHKAWLFVDEVAVE